MRIVLLVSLSLFAFAANSILCRLALAEHRIDAIGFTAIRLASGAVVLSLLALRSLTPWPGNVGSALALFLYAAPFSYAYLELGAGIGALVAFACVQLTMIGWAIAKGERPRLTVWLGLGSALFGLVLLTTRGASAPPILGTIAMMIAGIAWGAYTLRGRASKAAPLPTTAANFVLTLPLVAVMLAAGAIRSSMHTTTGGVLLALSSGAISSGIGYSLWYAALKHLTTTRAAILQLIAPILASVGGVIFLHETISVRLVVSSIAILGGVAIAIRARTT